MSENENSGSVHVAADAQFGNVGVLLPYDDFEDIYQGRSGQSCIAFPGGRDPHAQANEDGYDPQLQLGFAVPRGSRISIGIPVVENTQGTISRYRYFIVFRDRNIRDNRNPVRKSRRQPWHYPVQGLGAIDNSLVVAQGRYPIDARYASIGYEQTEPATGGIATTNYYPDCIIPQSQFQPGGFQDNAQPLRVQQGIYDPSVIPHARDALRPEYEVDAYGDDLIIFAQKIPDAEGAFDTWDFDNDDLAFSIFFGRGGYTEPYVHPGVYYVHGGIRVCTGSNP